MNVNNQMNRRTSLSLGNVVGNRNNLQNKKLEDIRQEWEDGDPKLINEIRYFGKSLDGSPQHFYTKSQESLVSYYQKCGQHLGFLRIHSILL